MRRTSTERGRSPLAMWHHRVMVAGGLPPVDLPSSQWRTQISHCATTVAGGSSTLYSMHSSLSTSSSWNLDRERVRLSAVSVSICSFKCGKLAS